MSIPLLMMLILPVSFPSGYMCIYTVQGIFQYLITTNKIPHTLDTNKTDFK